MERCSPRRRFTTADLVGVRSGGGACWRRSTRNNLMVHGASAIRTRTQRWSQDPGAKSSTAPGSSASCKDAVGGRTTANEARLWRGKTRTALETEESGESLRRSKILSSQVLLYYCRGFGAWMILSVALFGGEGGIRHALVILKKLYITTRWSYSFKASRSRGCVPCSRAVEEPSVSDKRNTLALHSNRHQEKQLN